MARSRFEFEMQQERRKQQQQQQSTAAPWNGFQEITAEGVEALVRSAAAAEAAHFAQHSSRSVSPSSRRLVNFLDDILDGLYYMKRIAEKMVRNGLHAGGKSSGDSPYVYSSHVVPLLTCSYVLSCSRVRVCVSRSPKLVLRWSS
jgi:hypothetical protein